MPRLLATAVLLAALAAGGCAVAPEGQGGQSVTHDVANYFAREWPLAGPPVIPADAQPCTCGASGGCVGAPHASSECETGDDWGNGAGGWRRVEATLPDPPPAVPLAPPAQGRFFPVPTRPAFSPQAAAPPPLVAIP